MIPKCSQSSSLCVISITAAEMAPFTEQLLNNLFKALAFPGSAENEYIMKGESDLPVIEMLLTHCHTKSKVNNIA